MEANAIIERGADGSYGIFIGSDNVPFGILGDGATVAEAKEDFYNSLEEMREVYAEKGKEFPEITFYFTYDLPSFLEYYSKVFSYASLERLTGVNQAQLSQYVQGYRNPSKKTVEKIESKLHDFAKEIGQVQFV